MEAFEKKYIFQKQDFDYVNPVFLCAFFNLCGVDLDLNPFFLLRFGFVFL